MEMNGVGQKIIHFALHAICLRVERLLALSNAWMFTLPQAISRILYFSGFDHENWPLKANAGHRINALQQRNNKLRVGREEYASTSGCEYSMLLELP